MKAVNLSSLVKVSLITIAILAGFESYRARLVGFDETTAVAVYLLLFAVLFAFVLLTAWIEATPLRWLLAAVIGGSFALYDAYFTVIGEGLTYSNFIVLLRTYHFAGDAVSQFGGAMYASFAKGAALLVGIALAPRGRRIRSQLVPRCASFVAVLLLTSMLYVRGGYGATGLHGSYVLPAYAALYAYEVVTDEVGQRRDVEISRSGSPVEHDIVLIIDESIRGDYLDINSDYGVSSGLSEPPAGWTVFNYGLAAAITNCSFNTNVTLRYGGTRDDYVRINGTMPSIWQYAKHAGMRTVYLDGQLTGGRTQNGMDDEELRFVDSFVQFDGVPVTHRDMRIAETLAELINNDEPELILVNKIGAHFPVHDKYPEEYMLYEPVLERGRYRDVSHTGSRDGFEGTTADWVLYRNAYRNTLAWNVGRFFAVLLERVKDSAAVIVYTADHGQELHENGDPGVQTHCRQDTASMEEGVVPLVVLQGSGAERLSFLTARGGNYNRASHYNIFATLLLLLGYEEQRTTQLYGPSLANETNDPMTFNIRFDSRLGADPVWKRIDVERVRRPPEGEGR